jgi:hypothetical protein
VKRLIEADEERKGPENAQATAVSTDCPNGRFHLARRNIQ